MAKSEAKTVGIVDTEEALTAKIAEVRAAQAIFATYTQEQPLRRAAVRQRL